MASDARERLGALTEKEKQTLRLIVRGHDAKSIARSLGLSVHTIHERLRCARRKMAVSSSREAARLLLELEGGDLASATPQTVGDKRIGEAASAVPMDQGSVPIGGTRTGYRPVLIATGVALMAGVLLLFALTLAPQLTSATQQAPALSAESPNPEVVDTARRWLALLDQGRWEETYQATGKPFHELNTEQAWAAASEKVRKPLGAMISRTFLSEESLPAPPDGYEVVKFRTSFANAKDKVETVTFEREDGAWRVVGVTVE